MYVSDKFKKSQHRPDRLLPSHSFCTFRKGARERNREIEGREREREVVCQRPKFLSARQKAFYVVDPCYATTQDVIARARVE